MAISLARIDQLASTTRVDEGSSSEDPHFPDLSQKTYLRCTIGKWKVDLDSEDAQEAFSGCSLGICGTVWAAALCTTHHIIASASLRGTNPPHPEASSLGDDPARKPIPQSSTVGTPTTRGCAPSDLVVHVTFSSKVSYIKSVYELVRC